jgi:hypothetical protein
MGVGELCNSIGFCAWGWLSDLARPRPQHPYSGQDIEEGTSEHGCSSSRPQSNLGHVLHIGCHVLLRADPVHVRGANGRQIFAHPTQDFTKHGRIVAWDVAQRRAVPGVPRVHELVGYGVGSSLYSSPLSTTRPSTPNSRMSLLGSRCKSSARDSVQMRSRPSIFSKKKDSPTLQLTLLPPKLSHSP